VFDEDHNRVVDIGGLKIARPSQWEFNDHGYEDRTMYDINRNIKETVPQIAKVVKPNSKYALKEDDNIFTHYLSYDSSVEVEGVKYIKFTSILFKINGDHDYEMADDSFMTKQLVIDSPKTASGIYLTSDVNKKQPLKLEVTHVPRNTEIKVGDIIVSEDDNQYRINLHNEEYVYITKQWIIGVWKDF
jgi:co-chaperonin GroES (HSP10)